jgi:peptide/nickel transport system substrate-binding protein
VLKESKPSKKGATAMNRQKKILEEMFSRGEISRRKFIEGAALLGLTAAASGILTPLQAKAATPKKGGRFRLGMAGGSISDNLDPALLTDHIPEHINWQVRNCLVEVNHKGQPIPELAESWESTPDAATWTFNLRKGVEFHNGKTLDAQDVIYSVNLHRGKDSKSVAKPYFNAVTDIRADGKYRVVCTLEGGNADFPFLMSDSHLTIIPDGTTDYSDGMGTGGYILQKFEPGTRCLVKRNPNYWKEGRAHFDEIETLYIADATARTNALSTNTIDAMNRCQLKTVNLLSKKPGLQIIRMKGAKHYPFPMRTDTAPFDNNDVRLALKYAVDREAMVKIILRGFGTVGNDTPIGPTYRYFNNDLPQRAYDPEKAKFHMKKAGMSDHVFKLHAADAAFAGAVDAAILYSENAKKAGINIEVVREPNDGYWSSVWMKKSWSQSYYSGMATEDWMFSQAYGIESTWNETFWKNGRFNKLLIEARSELDDAKRGSMYGEMQQILWDEGGTVIPLFADFVDAASDKVKFGPLSNKFALDAMRCGERWWFED